MKEPRISVLATEELYLVMLQAAAAIKASRKKDAARSPAVLNALIVQVSTARGSFEHAQRKAAETAANRTGTQAGEPDGGVQTL